MLFVSLVVKRVTTQDLIIFCQESHNFILLDTKYLNP